MSAVPSTLPKASDSELAFFETQQLPPEQRGVSFEALFYRRLQQVTTRIHETENVEQIMFDASQDICKLLNADRLTLYAVNEDRTAIVSKVKTGLNTSRELKLPISAQSLAGYAALSRQVLNIADVYDDAALKRINPALTFLKEVDKRSGYRTKQMLVLPITDGESLHGVLQVINNKSDQPFRDLELDGATQLCKTLATAIRQRMQKAADEQRRRATKYDGLVNEGVLTAVELQNCIQQAREKSEPVERTLIAQFKLRPAQIGSSLAKFFGVPYETFKADRIRSQQLQGQLKREFLLEQGWIPLEETADGLVVMCLDPEAVRNSRVVPQVFPRFTKFAYRVTTQADFEETLSQLYGGTEGASIGEMLADMSAPLDEEATDESALESAAADNELVKFVNKVIIDACNQKASDIHVEPLPGKAKTGIRFRIDGSLQPYIEVPSQYRQALVTRLKIMCDLDISEKRKPQDGKIGFKKFGPLDIELRVATIPTAGGVEDVVMRILAAGEPIPLDKLGLSPHNRERLEQTVRKPYGLFYVCGPRFRQDNHAALDPEAAEHARNEDLDRRGPGRNHAKGPASGTDQQEGGDRLATVMRAFLRADPDIIMVGESRDHETVSMGIEASLTGHLVFSTLHTNSAPESIVRLLDMGMDPFNFADALLGILAQRLAKKLCECKVGYSAGSGRGKALHRGIRRRTASHRRLEGRLRRGGSKLYESWVS